MLGKTSLSRRRRPTLACLAIAILFGTGVSAAGGLSTSPARAAAAPNTPYALEAQALLGPDGTDLYLTTSSATLPDPGMLDKVQLKTSNPDGTALHTENRFDIPVRDGVATIHLDGLRRLDRLEIKAHAKAPDGAPVVPSQNNVAAETRVLRRPDLTVTASLPARLTRRHAFTLTATVHEIGGDTGATAALGVFDGTQPAGGVPQRVVVAPGGTATVPVTVRFETAGVHTLRTAVSGAAPGEWTEANNDTTDSAPVAMYTADGAVVSQSGPATAAGMEILKAGGNAFDAAAAVQFALNVTLPHLNGLGGGTAMLVHLADGRNFAIDAREQAPAATTPDTYRGKDATLLATSGSAVGVPETLAGVGAMLTRWGTMPLARTLQPAIHLAEDGFPVGVALANASANGLVRVQPEMRATFQPNGSPLARGQVFKWPDLAKTFRLVAAQGPDAFYTGPLADALVQVQHRTRTPGAEGLMTAADLAGHAVNVRNAIRGSYRGVEIVTVPPSSSGGLGLLQMLGLVERFPLGDAGRGFAFGGVRSMNVEIEAIRLELGDRAMWMGDDDFFAVPKEGLLAPAYLAGRSAPIDPARRIFPIVPGDPFAFQPTAPPVEFPNDTDNFETTHFSVLDKWGNAVAFTTTLQGTWGSALMVPGYGVVLNNSLVNFNLTPTKGVPAGNPGVNDAGPNKRPLGNLAPVMLLADGEPVIVAGTPGGVFIPQALFQVIVDLVDHHMTLQQAVDAPRFWLGPNPENRVDVNPGFDPGVLDELRRIIGQKIAPPGVGPFVGSNFVEAIGVDPTTVDLTSVPDLRAPDSIGDVLAP